MQGLETRGEFEFRWKRLQRWLSQYPRGWRWAVAAFVLATALLGIGVRAWPGGLLGKQAPWEQAIYTLQSGEPTAALRLMEDVAGGQPLGQVEMAQRAMAWWTAGFRAQAREELGEVNSWLLPPGDRLFVRAVEAQVQGDPAAALALLRRVELLVDTAEDGEQAFEKAQGAEYALVLMDLQMPRMGGLAACRALRELPGWADVPILAMTATAFDEDRRACRKAGMNDFIAKPVDAETLYSVLLRWLPHHAVQPAGPATCAS